jgi:hypothetical protein
VPKSPEASQPPSSSTPGTKGSPNSGSK